MLTTASRDAFLATFDGKYLGFLTGITSFRTPSVTEASYSGYARILISLGAAADADSGREVKNDIELLGGANGGGDVDLIGFGIYAASSGGSPTHIGLLDTDPPKFGTVTNASPGVITAPAHGLVVDQRCFIMGGPGFALPAGISEGTAYYVGTVPSADSLTLSTTAANANPVNTTTVGSCVILPYSVVTLSGGVAPQFDIDGFVIQV